MSLCLTTTQMCLQISLVKLGNQGRIYFIFKKLVHSISSNNSNNQTGFLPLQINQNNGKNKWTRTWCEPRSRGPTWSLLVLSILVKIQALIRSLPDPLPFPWALSVSGYCWCLVHTDFSLFHFDVPSHCMQLYFLSLVPQDRVLHVASWALSLLCSQIDFHFTMSGPQPMWKSLRQQRCVEDPGVWSKIRPTLHCD